jgi:Zn finger protein HypA/HybF involved in hydrogenase expression
MLFFLRVTWRRICAGFHSVCIENTSSRCVHCGTKKARESWRMSMYCPDCHAHIKLAEPRSLT